MKKTSYSNYLNIRMVLLIIVNILASIFIVYYIFMTYANKIDNERNELYRLEVEKTLKNNMIIQMENINEQLDGMEKSVSYFQKDLADIFEKPLSSIPEVDQSAYKVYDDGTLSSIDESGSSLYYNYRQNGGEIDWERIRRINAMNLRFQNIMDTMKSIKQYYFNSYDGITIVNPGVPRASEIYSNEMDANEFALYYLADEEHNPDKAVRWTPVYVDPTGSGWVISCIAPVYSGQELEGVVGTFVTIDDFTRALTNFTSAYPYTVLILEDDNLIAYSDGLNFLKSQSVMAYNYEKAIEKDVLLSDQESVDTILDSDQYTVIESLVMQNSVDNQVLTEYMTHDEETYIVFKSSLQVVGWNYVFIIDKADTMVPVENVNSAYTRYFIIGNIVLFIVSLMLIFISSKVAKFSTNHILKPINDLTDQVNKLDFDKEDLINLDSDILEVDLLINTINDQQKRMSKGVEQLISLEKEKEKVRAHNEMLRELSYKDMLTGLVNRREIEVRLDQLVNHFNTSGEMCSIVLIDIDHFKSVNDTFGHGIGDEVLKNLSKEVCFSLGEDDIFGRWGGEEFIIICKNTGLEQARALAERVRKLVEETELIPQRQITISLGVAEIQPGEDKYKLFKRADELLYRAKESGRNQVAI